MSSAEPKAEADNIYRDLYYKQLLDEVFVISGIIKIELTVISRAED